jgi:TPR repeat protein
MLWMQGEEDATLSGAPLHTTAAPFVLDRGDTLQAGRLEVRARLGRGACGSVYRVFDNQLQLGLALKAIVVREENSTSILKQAANEFQVREKIRDRAHILGAYFPLLENHKGLSMLVLPMELADGGSLRAWMNKNPAIRERQEEALEYFRQVCIGTMAVHQAGLVHLDLKPENIMLVKDVAKISDFGFSQDFMSLASGPPVAWPVGGGTAEYMAPEQMMAARFKDVGHEADIYALGCILFELVDGHPPYMGTVAEILEKHHRGIIPRLKDVGEILSTIIWQALHSDPSKRFGSARELLDAIEQTDSTGSKDRQIENREERLEAVCQRFSMYRDAFKGERILSKVKKHFPDALDLLKWGVEAGSPSALFQFGALHFWGDGIPQDAVEAVRLWMRAAEEGSPAACFAVGTCYDSGKGVREDQKEAAQWFRKAAEGGFSEAQKELGNCYFYGEGVPQDHTEAVKWFQRAAENGNREAQCNLGYCHYRGIGVPQNRSEALRWVRQAAEAGSQNAKELLERLLMQ